MRQIRRYSSARAALAGVTFLGLLLPGLVDFCLDSSHQHGLDSHAADAREHGGWVLETPEHPFHQTPQIEPAARVKRSLCAVCWTQQHSTAWLGPSTGLAANLESRATLLAASQLPAPRQPLTELQPRAPPRV